MKYVSPVCLTAVALFSLSGCNSSDNNGENDKDEKVRRSLMVMIDGARYEAVVNAMTPNLDKLAMQQAYTGGISNTLSQSGTSTVEGESTLWTGSWHSVQRAGDGGFKSVWQHLKQEQPDMRIGLYPNWPIFGHVSFDLSEIPDKQAFATGTDRPSEHVNAQAVATMINSGDFDALFTTIDMVDYSGHCYYGNSGGAWTNDYIDTIEEADEVFGYLYDAIQERELNYNEEWLVLVAPDHGFNRQKDNGSVDCSHGSQDIDAKKIWVAANQVELHNEQFTSPLKQIGNRDKDGLYRYVAQTDVAPTLLAWHGVELDPEWHIEGTSFIGDLSVRGLFASEVEQNNAVKLTFTPSNSQSVSILRDGQEITTINDSIKGELYTYVDELLNLEGGNHTFRYTLINNGIPKTIVANINVIDEVDFDELPFDSMSSVFGFDGALTENAISGGTDLQVTGVPQVQALPGKFGNSLHHVREHNNDLLLEDNQTNTDRFTISFWFAGDGTSYDPAVITNKNWSSAADGIVLAQLNDSLKLQAGMDGEGSCCFVQLPYTPTIDISNPQWNLIVVSVDKNQTWQSGEGKGVMSFGVFSSTEQLHFGSVDLLNDRVNSINTGKPWLINNDHSQAYNNGHAALFDELVVWDDISFSPGEVIALGSSNRSVLEKITMMTTSTIPNKLSAATYIGQNPNMTETELQTEAIWQRARQMDELKAEIQDKEHDHEHGHGHKH